MSDKTDALIETIFWTQSDDEGMAAMQDLRAEIARIEAERDEARDALRAEIASLEARIAELEAAARPMKIDYEHPVLDSNVLMWCTRCETWHIGRDVQGWNVSDISTHWLPMPPAPEAA